MADQIRVLLVDDDEEDFLITKSLLGKVRSKYQYQVEWIDNYDEALDELQKKAHAIYLIDYRLGVHSGLDLIHELSAKDFELPMILMTGQGDSEIDEKAMEAGATDYLVKGSLNPGELDRAIRYGIRHSEDLRQIRKLNAGLEQRVEERTAELEKTVDQLEETNTHLKAVIEERGRFEEALIESQRLYISMATNYPNGIIGVLNKEFKFEFIEGTELKKLGFSGVTMTGRSIDEFFPDIIRDENATHFESAFKGEAVDFEYQSQDQIYLTNLVPLKNSTGLTEQILIVTVNISEQKMAEESIRISLERERQLSELKSRFVTMASHEFRTPLSTILSSVELISHYRKTEDQDRRDKHLDRIRKSINHLTDLLNDFLSLEKLEEGREDCNPVAFTPEKLIAETIEEVKCLLTGSQLIDWQHEGEGEIFQDVKMLRNILINLLSNAIKYSPAGREILLQSSVNDEQLFIRVKDAGIGIPEEDQVHLFDRFFRAGNVTNIQGTGLGLSIVKKYLDLMGGRISFSSTFGEGTEFEVYLPVNYRQAAV